MDKSKVDEAEHEVEDEGENVDTYETVSLGTRILIMVKIIKQLGLGRGADLTYIEVPSLFMGDESTHEYFSDLLAKHFDLLIKANNTDCPIHRMLMILKYTFTVNQTTTDTTKQPMNALLGETRSSNFHTVDLDDPTKIITDNYYMVEQQQTEIIPITACCFYNKRLGITINYHANFTGTFEGTSLKGPFRGSFKIHFSKYNEIYSVKQPALWGRYLRGFAEYSGEARIVSSNSNHTIICNYLAKPIFGGSYNMIDANLYELDSVPTLENSNKQVLPSPLFRIQGAWDGETKITNCQTNETSIFFTKAPPTTIIIPEILETDSSIVWKRLVDASKNGKDLLKVKFKIVDHYKKLDWKPKHFTLNETTGIWELTNFKQ